jgi:hypothetical protein
MLLAMLNLYRVKQIKICGKWGQTYRYVANPVKYSVLWQIQYLSQFKSFLHETFIVYVSIGLLSWLIILCVCMCAHACTAHLNVHATWGSKQTIKFQLNVVGFLWNLVWLSRSYQGCTQKNGSDMYMHASTVHINVHAHFAIL